MIDDPAVPNSACNGPQAFRTGWRIIKDWVDSQIAYVQAGQGRMDQVFLPYALLPDGQTSFHEFIATKGMDKLLIAGGKIQLRSRRSITNGVWKKHFPGCRSRES